MISSLVWVKRGVPSRHPVKFNITDEEELARVQKLTNLEFGDAQMQLEQAKREALEMGGEEGGGEEWQDESGDDDGGDDEEMNTGGEAADAQTNTTATATAADDPSDLSRYNLDSYDDEQSTGVAMGAFSNIRGLQFYKNNDDDPYITLKDDAQDDDEEREAMEILPSDNMLISAKTEDEVSLLEAHVYASDTVEGQDVAESSLFVHHDLLLPSFPLCLESVNHNVGPSSSSRNYLAVSTMEPEVEIWNMDVVDGLVPDVVLGDRQATKDWEKQAKKKGTGKKKKRELAVRPASSQYHTDAVLSISWNPFVPNLLVTSSADTTIKLWDLDAKPAAHGGLEAIRDFRIHSDKVQSVAWNTSATAPGAADTSSTDRSLLASGGYDGFVKIWDVRSPADTTRSIRVDGEVEKIRWHPWKANHLLVALDSGIVQEYDVSTTKPTLVWTLSAHESACTSVDYSPHIPGCLLTAGLDRSLKVWNIVDATATGKREISLVASRDPGAGKIFAASFSPDDPLCIAVAGSAGKVKVWNALGARGVRSVFADQLRGVVAARKANGGQGAQPDADADVDGDGEIVEVIPDDEDSDNEEEGDGGDEGDEGEAEEVKMDE